MTVDLSRLERFFLARVEKSGDCWVWRGRITGRGYGTIKMGENSREILAHRASWMLHCGAIPAGMVVCHKCDNPTCVRPDHLFVGTQKENIWDAIKKGRYTHQGKYLPNYSAKTACPSGHAYDDQNTGISNCNGKRARYCRACQRERARKRREKKRCLVLTCE